MCPCTHPAPLAPFGDITKVTLDDELLPESGTLAWLLHDEAAIKVYFKNTGNEASAFHIWTDKDGVAIPGADVTTAEIPADGIEYYIDCGSFIPSAEAVRTITAHINP